MQDSMVDAMKFWITDADIDGFRCDMAHLVPLDFWKKAKSELDKAKSQLFWLAECEEANYHEVFDATYTWQWMHKTEDYVKGEENVDVLVNLSFDTNLFQIKDHFSYIFCYTFDSCKFMISTGNINPDDGITFKRV